MSDIKDPIKEAFAKAKQDIFNLSSQIESLKREVHSLKEALKTQSVRQTDSQTHVSTDNSQNKTIQHINPAENTSQTHNPAENKPFYGLKTQFSNFSTGNRGVPADRQTDQQTDNKHPNIELNEPLRQLTPRQTPQFDTHTTQKPSQKSLENVTEVIASLDTLKKELRQKFKRLTKQEMMVFSSIYHLEEEGLIVDYTLLSQRISLTESSIRDYIQRLIKKGIPLVKNKENNKRILLSIPQELKKIASLSTIERLREL